MEHRLDPLLRPRSVAVVGASARVDSLGDWALRNLGLGGFKGRLYPVNPNYDNLQGHRCFPSLADLPETPDCVIFAVGDHRLESSLDEAIAAGVPAAVIQSTLYLDNDEEPALRERVRRKIRDAGMLVCGANGMGFYNVRDHVWTCGFDSTSHTAPGNVALISHSGSGMSGIIDCDERLRINVAVSTGNELSVTMDEYLDFVLELPETRAVGLFIETARNPEGFHAALAKAARRSIPIVALKVGRTQRSAELAVSHSGAMAGVDATYEALFDRYGVQRARDQDEFATMLIMFAEMFPVAAGGLVTLHDSGGERQLLVDLADEIGVPLTLARMHADTDYAVIEIGMSNPGEITPLSQMTRPHVAMVTTVAAAHLASFDNLAGIAVEKACIMDGLEPGGVAVLNGDIKTSPILQDHAAKLGAKCVLFGETAADWTVKDVRITGDVTVIAATAGDDDYLFKLSVPGRHFAMNAVGVLAVAEALGADPVAASLDIAAWVPPAGRGTREVIVTDIANDGESLELLDDAFNANPTSLAASLEVLAASTPTNGVGRIVKGRRIAILGDMLELGEKEADMHRDMTDNAHLKSLDLIHCAGPLMRHLWEALPEEQRGRWAQTAAELVPHAPQLVDAGDVVLVKGSKGSKVSLVVDAIRKLGHRRPQQQ